MPYSGVELEFWLLPFVCAIKCYSNAHDVDTRTIVKPTRYDRSPRKTLHPSLPSSVTAYI